MRISEFEDYREFFERFSPIWLENEAECGVIYRISKANIPGMRYFAMSDNEDKVLLTACLDSSDQIILSGPEVEAASCLASHLAEAGLEAPGIFAPSHLSRSFAESYSANTGKTFRVVKELGHYGLHELQFIPSQLGEVRLATLDERELLTAFRAASQSEGNTQRPVDPGETVTREIDAGNLYVLELSDGQIVSTGSIQWDRSPVSAYVDHVYTSVDYRQNGYAAYLVYALSQLILERNLVARLSVDFENFPAIAVYEKLGYKLECQMDNLRQVSQD